DPVPAVARAVREAAARLEAAGTPVVELTIPRPADARALFDAAFVLDGGRGLRRLVGDGPLHPLLARALAAAPAGARDAAGRRALVAEIAAYRAAFAAALDRAGVDALVGAVHALPAVPHGASADV